MLEIRSHLCNLAIYANIVYLTLTCNDWSMKRDIHFLKASEEIPVKMADRSTTKSTIKQQISYPGPLT